MRRLWTTPGRYRCYVPGILCLLLAATPLRAGETVQSLRYGTTLFYLYQQDYFNALTELMVAQSMQALGPHADNAELLRGGMALSWRMDREAEQVFLEHLKTPPDGVEPGRAWFYLARLAWRQGDFDRATDALANALPLLDPSLMEEAAHYRLGIALQAQDFDAACEALSGLPRGSPWRAYALYNLGAALASEGQWGAAVEAFHSIEWNPRNQELWALRDRAMTAAGYAQLADARFEGARADFTQVRLDGVMAPRALLGHGWAALQSDDTLGALSPWQRLIREPASNVSVREALMAVPYAYEQLGRQGLALAHYREASTAFRAELEVVRRGIAVFRESALPVELSVSRSGSGWGSRDDWLPVSDEAAYLRSLFSSHSFQTAVADFRDLQHIDQRLVRARARLAVLREADAEQQQDWQRIARDGGRERLAARHAALMRAAESLRQRLHMAEATVEGNEEGDKDGYEYGRALVSASDEALWQRLESAERAARSLDAEAALRQLAVMKGVLIWQNSEAFPDRRWRAQRALAELDEALGESSERLASLDEALAGRQRSSQSGAIDVLVRRVTQQATRVDSALTRSEAALRRQAIAVLEMEKRQLMQALSQSQLAAAQLLETSTAGLTP
ncbi:MAG: hypothetical protein AAGI24_10060 [Pseudomonadota bacterium]